MKATPAPTIITRRGYRFPPGPKSDLLWKVLRTRRPVQPIEFFQRLVRDYGDVVHYRVRRQDVIFLNDPEYIQEILVAQNDNFIKERTVQRSKLLLGEGMITAEGAAHRAQRQAANPAFRRERIPSYAAVMVAEAARTRDSWIPGATLDVSLEMMYLTLNVVARALFDTDLGDEVREIVAAINTIMGMYHFMLLAPAAEQLVRLPLPKVATFRRARARIDRAVARMIEEHRAGRRDPDDLLSMMLRAHGKRGEDRQLRDEVVTIFLAGYETVSNALTWTWYLLSQNPDAEQKLHAEVDGVLAGREATADDYPRLHYTEMVLAEAMRLYPPAWGMGRQALEDFELGPYRFPARTTIAMSQYILQRDDRYFPLPERFDPERFTAAAKARRPKFAYFPFGGGGRQCIGETFAWMEGTLVLATIAQKWRLQLDPEQKVEPEPLITLRPKYGMRMRAERR
ncbi:MAG TPA: cytochrome P450 [Terriglobales bacterium]|nr:cytochrome P450 [Terriglobales bacterium]